MILGKPAPDFELEGYDPNIKDFVKVRISDFKGKFLIILFYPGDFTFVCPTELAAVATIYGKIRELGADVVAVSTDSKFVHKAFCEHEPLMRGVNFLLLSDPTGNMCRAYDMYVEEQGYARRGIYIINPDGIVVDVEASEAPVGKGTEEILRKLMAWKYVYEHPDEVCPADWEPGKKTLKPTPEVVGHIGDYLSLKEFISQYYQDDEKGYMVE
ncbi:MAG: peroxiredoxin [Thermosulfidibacteraceae bacterium]|jgi:peroxiredoxin (alkyl hydroperoxide reductase subunit C)